MPRSGSTLLGAILNQNPDVEVTPTSPLLDVLCHTNETFNLVSQQYTFDPIVVDNVYSSMIDAFFKHIKKPVVIDKHRGWPKNIVAIRKVITTTPKIICTVRPISEVITSYIKLMMKNNQDNFVDNRLREKNIPKTVENRAACLWNEYIHDSYESMSYGIKNYPEYLHLVKYDDLMNDPEKVMYDVCNFLGISFIRYDFLNIKNDFTEKDKAWGLEGLHDIRSKLGRTSTPPEEILGKYLTDYYNQFNL